MPRLRSIVPVVLLLSSLSRPAWADEHAVQVTAGFGVHLSTALEEGPSSYGFFGEGEYIYGLTSFLSARSYAGILITSTAESSCEAFDPCEMSSRLVFLGERVRIEAPIPYVSPFLELGFGLSLGSLVSRVSSYTDEDLGGATIHVPLTIGLALGRDRQVDVMLSYLFHPTEDSVSGAFAAGVTVPLR